MGEPQEISVHKNILINKNASELFRIWRNFENLPQILHFLQNVLIIDPKKSRWTALVKKEQIIWDVEIVEEQSDTISWHSENNPNIFHQGTLSLTAITHKRTQLHLQLHFFFPKLYETQKPPLFDSDFSYRIEQDLQRFKLSTEAEEFYGKKRDNDIPEGFPPPENPRKSFQ